MTAQVLTWATAAFCVVRGLPVLVEGWKYFARAAAASGNKLSKNKLARNAA